MEEKRKFRTAVITSSDSGYRGEREDLSGPAIEEILLANGEYEVVQKTVLPDDYAMLKDCMAKICDEGSADLILTTGGTGFSP